MKKVFFIVTLTSIVIALLPLLTLGYIFFTRKNDYKDFLPELCSECSLDYDVIRALIYTESKWRTQAVSSKNAKGLMQVTDSTAQYINDFYDLNIEDIDLFDAETNLTIGCYYLKYLSNKFTDKNTVLAAYNAGETIVRGWLKNTEYSADGVALTNIPYKETKYYLKKISFNAKLYKVLY